MSFQFFGQALEFESPKRFDPKIVNVYTPMGFNVDDVAQIIVELQFENTCEKLGPVSVFPHDDFKNVLLVHVEGIKHRPAPGEKPCRRSRNAVPVPIDIGLLDPKHYELRNFKNLDQNLGQLRVRAEKDARIDGLQYAPVDSLVIRPDVRGYRRYFSLAGTFSDNCTTFDMENFRVSRTTNDMIEILPAVKTFQNASCQEGSFPFFETFEIPQRQGRHRIDSGRYLFHVRVANGMSFNKIDTLLMPED